MNMTLVSQNLYKVGTFKYNVCNGICKRLYKAHKIGPHTSLYVNNVRCTHCYRFISRDGMYMGKSNWRCKCCNYPVRWTPYAGRKSIKMNRAWFPEVPQIVEVTI